MMKRAGEPPPKRIKVREDGEWLVPCLTGISFDDESTAEAYIIGSNRLVELGGWDEEALQAIITTEGFDADGTGLTLDLGGLDTLALDTSGLDPVTAADEGTTAGEEIKLGSIRVGKYRVPITESEKRALITRVEEYEERTGEMLGFWGLLLG